MYMLSQVRKRLEQIIDHWRGKGIYDDDTAAAMIAAMLTAKPSATIPEPGEKVRWRRTCCCIRAEVVPYPDVIASQCSLSRIDVTHVTPINKHATTRPSCHNL